MPARPLRYLWSGVLSLLFLAAGPAPAAQTGLDAPNVVAISEQLVTSGQPSARALSELSAQGFRAVIYLAPLTVPGAVPNEAELLRQQGLEFVHIPIAFNQPTEADLAAFIEAMNRLKGRKLLVHCQVNMRASSLTFLYRVLVGKAHAEQAYEAVAQVWSPEGPWKALMVNQLSKAGIHFEPY